MQRNAASRFTGRVLLSVASMAAGAAACAANIVGMPPTSSSPQIMLYVSQPLWSRGTSRVYGLRIEVVRALPTSPQSATGSLRRSELIDLRIEPHSQIRIEFARRLSWDFMRAVPGTQAGLSPGLPIKSIIFQDPPGLQAWDLRASGLSLMAGRVVPDPHASGVSVTVAAAVITLPWTPSAGRPVTAASGLATPWPLGRVCGLSACPGRWTDVESQKRAF